MTTAQSAGRSTAWLTDAADEVARAGDRGVDPQPTGRAGVMRTMTDDEPGAPYAAWAAAWAGMAALATANGITRGLYTGRLGERRAHQVSTVTLIAALLPYARAVERRLPIRTARSAVVPIR